MIIPPVQSNWDSDLYLLHWYFNTDTRNQMFSLILNTTKIGNQSVACTQLMREEAGTFECEFCYSTGDSCQSLTCIPATRTPTILPNLTELTYCYRATASVNGSAVAVIQDIFNTGSYIYNNIIMKL